MQDTQWDGLQHSHSAGQSYLLVLGMGIGGSVLFPDSPDSDNSFLGYGTGDGTTSFPKSKAIVPMESCFSKGDHVNLSTARVICIPKDSLWGLSFALLPWRGEWIFCFSYYAIALSI